VSEIEIEKQMNHAVRITVEDPHEPTDANPPQTFDEKTLRVKVE
jgi:hypothetical protein